MEANKRGLKMYGLTENRLLVEYNEEENGDYLSRPDNIGKLQLHNFRLMERFCHRHANEDESINSYYRFYTVIKNFSDVKFEHFEKEDIEKYDIYKDVKKTPCCFFSFFVSEKNGKDFVFVSILINWLKQQFEQFENVNCFISIIDNKGFERGNQTVMSFSSSESYDCEYNDYVPSFSLFSLGDILRHADELLHGDDLILCVNFDLDKFFYPKNEIKGGSFHFSDIECRCTLPGMRKNIHKHITEFNKKKSGHFINACNRYYNTALQLSKIYRALTGDRLLLTNTESIGIMYRVAHEYKIPRVVELCKDALKSLICIDNISLIKKLAEIFYDVELKETVKHFLEDIKEYGKFFCNKFNADLQEAKEEIVDFESEHIHHALSEYLQCENPIYRKENYCFLNQDKIERKIHAFAVVNQNEKGELVLDLDSDFGKFLRKTSIVLKDMCKLCPTDKTVLIKEKYLEAIKNIYRLSSGTNYIKANTIHDIITLYEVSDFYNIPPLLEFCRNLFKKYICVRNAESIRKLSEMCIGDVDLKNIVSNFDVDRNKFDSMIRSKRKLVKKTKDFEFNGTLEANFPEIQYDFYH